jgi:hypothetical protein
MRQIELFDAAPLPAPLGPQFAICGQGRLHLMLMLARGAGATRSLGYRNNDNPFRVHGGVFFRASAAVAIT